MRLREIIIANVFYNILFIVGIYIFNPSPVENFAFGLILLAWLFYMSALFMTILTFASMPFTRKLLEGEDEKYGVVERKTALYFFGMISIAIALFLGQLIPTLIMAAYSTSV